MGSRYKNGLYKRWLFPKKKSPVDKKLISVVSPNKIEKALEKEQKMGNNIGATKNNITTVRLHLELKNDSLSDYQKKMLRRYGESSDGGSVTRGILIPLDMPLHNLHYAIQNKGGNRKQVAERNRFNSCTG